MDNKSYFDSPEFREILHKYEQTRAKNVCSYFGIDDLLDILVYYIFQDAIDAADEVYAQALALHPSAPELTKMEVKLLLAKNEPEKALTVLGSQGFTDDDESKLLQAQVFIALKEYREAREIAIEVLNQQQVTQEIACEALEILLDGGFAQEALQITDYALHKYPGQRNLLEVRAECLIELQDTNGAIEIYNELLDRDPYSTFYWEQLAHIYYMINKYGKALECFEYELAIGEEIDYARMMQAYCYYFMRDYRRAAELFDTLAKRYTSSAMPRFYKGLCLWATGEAEDALDAFDDVIDLCEEDSIETMVARINRAIILSSLNEKESATGAISLALLMHPNNMKQLLVGEGELYDLRDKENLTFKEMNVIDIKDWSTEECLFALAMHLIKYKHHELAKSVLFYMRHMSKDKSDVDAGIAYTMYTIGEEECAIPHMNSAINGRSNLLFELFGLVYDADISLAEFLEKIKK